jgi:type IX secretion system PorP/SprF family membrane protein
MPTPKKYNPAKMNFKASLIALIAALAFIVPTQSVRAQSDAQFSQYYEVPTYYNPAAIGQTDMIKIRGGARLQWVGIDNAPQTFIVTGDMPLKLFNKRFGVGLVLDQESIGLYKTLNLDAQLGYKFKKWGGEFTAAVNVGMYDESFKGSEVVIPDDDDYHQSTDDAIPTTDIHGTTIDLGVGIWYKHPKFWAGLSMTHVNSPTVTMNSDSGSSESTERTFEFQAGRTLYFMGGCNIQIKNTLFEMIPSVLVKSDFTFTTGELTARARYNKFLSFGVGYRWDDAVVVTLGAEIKNFYIGYSYDYATSAISKASSGSHEVFVGYSLKLDLGDKNRNRHKSIRLM